MCADESDLVPMHPVWWVIETKHGTPAYTKARLWVEARTAFGGACDPARVRDAGTLERLERDQAFHEKVQAEVRDRHGRLP